MKNCTCCKISKNIDEFPHSKQTKDGLFPYCRSCTRIKAAESRARMGIPTREKPRGKEDLPKRKICAKCKIEKDSAEFRIKRPTYKDKTYWQLYSQCNKCCYENSKAYYERHKNDDNFKKKNRERVRQYALANSENIKIARSSERYKKKHVEWESKRYHRKRDEINAKAKLRRQTAEYKAKLKAYRVKNKEKIFAQEAITKRRYHEKHRDNLTDKYVGRLLKAQGVADDAVLQNYPKIIEAKRLQLLITRKINNHAN